MVVRELALRLKKLKKLFEQFAVRGIFKFESSCLTLFEMHDMALTASTDESHFWYPLSPHDLWIPFVHCMMTVIDEYHDEFKYEHILVVEYYEWIARVAIKYYELKMNLKLLSKQDTQKSNDG